MIGWPSSGNSENEILVHSVADLLQGVLEPQRLRGVGEPIRTATFVRKGADDWGLQIGRTPRAGPDDLVFDLTNRRFSPSTVGWTVARGGIRRLADPARPTRLPRRTAGSAVLLALVSVGL